MIKTTELNLKKKLYFLVVLLKDEENKMNMNSLNSIQIELYRELNKSQDKLELIFLYWILFFLAAFFLF